MKNTGYGTLYKTAFVTILMLMLAIDAVIVYLLTTIGNNSNIGGNIFTQNIMMVAGGSISLLVLLTIIAIIMSRHDSRAS